MAEDGDQKHCCRICSKRFPCGRSLGGHMRSHMTVSEGKSEKKKTSVSGMNNNNTAKGSVGFEGYGLRENPKKTWRLSNSSNAPQQGKACKECGKVFQSWKALFGHMRCHSERSAQGDSWSVGSHKPVFDSQSDNEGVAPWQRRSRRSRYGASPSFSFANGSSSVSEMEQEQEDVAISLMMLSRDVGSWGGINSVTESSDNNSIAMEVRSSVIDKGLREKDGNHELKNKLGRSAYRLSEDGSLRNTARRVESDASDDCFNWNDEFNGSKLDYGASDEEMEKGFAKLGLPYRKLGEESCKKKMGSNLSGVELRKDLLKEREFDGAGSSKRAQYDSCDTELGIKKVKHEASVNEGGKNQFKRSRFQCSTCNKSFHSYQALGGHRASHKKIKGCFASKNEASETSCEGEGSPGPRADDKLKACGIEDLIEADGAGESSEAQKKAKNHECPICLKVFASGQALGGHKRSHLASSSDPRGENSRSIVIQQQRPGIPEMLDLNLPAPEDDTSGFRSWWTGSNPKHEQLVGMISN